MRVVKTELLQFSELSEDAKYNAIDKWMHDGGPDWIFQDADNSLEVFLKMFDINKYDIDYINNYQHVKLDHFDDAVLNLSGPRLVSYLWNNYGGSLYKPHFINSINRDGAVYHKRIRSEQLKNGKYFNPYYSGYKKTNCCVLTGVCYDNDLLQPIYDVMECRDLTSTFEDVLNACIQSFSKAVQNEYECYSENKDNVTGDHFEANGYEFTKDGERF